jgi:hypothetical protein
LAFGVAAAFVSIRVIFVSISAISTSTGIPKSNPNGNPVQISRVFIFSTPRNFENGFCLSQSLTKAARALLEPVVNALDAAFSIVGRQRRTRALINQ